MSCRKPTADELATLKSMISPHQMILGTPLMKMMATYGSRGMMMMMMTLMTLTTFMDT
jgi:hypothetical protein